MMATRTRRTRRLRIFSALTAVFLLAGLVGAQG